ncbi:hypothetical protein LJR153_004821 [Paenibacillus sp. LjRoot153]
MKLTIAFSRLAMASPAGVSALRANSSALLRSLSSSAYTQGKALFTSDPTSVWLIWSGNSSLPAFKASACAMRSFSSCVSSPPAAAAGTGANANKENSMMTTRMRETLIKAFSRFIFVLLLFLRQPLKSRFRVAQFLDFGIFYNFTDKNVVFVKDFGFFDELTIKYASVSY